MIGRSQGWVACLALLGMLTSAFALAQDDEANEFSVVPEQPRPYEIARPQESSEYKNINFEDSFKRLELAELPKPYRHHYLGAEGYRPNTMGLSVGGRAPGVGAMFDYSFNRLGIGTSLSYRSVVGFRQEVDNATVRGSGQTFFNVYGFYNIIRYPVSPFILVGMEYATGTEESLNAIAGLGLEARLWYGLTLILEYVRHETDKAGFPGLTLAWAF